MHARGSHANRCFWIGRQRTDAARTLTLRGLFLSAGYLPLTRRSILGTIRDMRQTKWLVHRRTLVLLPLVFGASFGMVYIGDASSEPMVDDGAPSGMVTFVGGGVCPPGWVHMSDLEGRAVVGIVVKEDLGIEVGTPFTDREARIHHHDFTGEVMVGPKPVSIPNGANGIVAEAGTYPIEGTTGDDDAGLPFFQMEGCMKP